MFRSLLEPLQKHVGSFPGVGGSTQSRLDFPVGIMKVACWKRLVDIAFLQFGEYLA